MMTTWFTRSGWFYRPGSWQGWLVLAVGLAWMVHVFLFVDGRSHSVSDTLYGIFPYWTPTLLLLDWIARRTSASSSN